MGFVVKKPINDRNQCALSVSVVRPFGLLPQRRIETWAVVDTGSAGTLIRSDLAAELELEPVGWTTIIHAAHPDAADCATTIADLILEGDGRMAYTFHLNLIVAPGEMSPGLILGMDCFADGVLTINCRAGWWSFEVVDP